MKNEVIMTLFTIVFGIMLAELFMSFHKLIRKRKSVNWHWLPVIVAWYLFLTILNNWWQLTQLQNSTGTNIIYFIVYGHWLFLIYLVVSTVLPNMGEEKEIDLKEYYFANHKYFWGLMSWIIIISLAINFIKKFDQIESLDILTISGLLILPILTLILAFTKRYWVHSVIVFLLIIGILFSFVNSYV